jgi:hypothetical protein
MSGSITGMADILRYHEADRHLQLGNTIKTDRMSVEGTNNKVTGHESNIAGTEDEQERTGENAAGQRGKLPHKSDDITRMLMRGKATYVTPT